MRRSILNSFITLLTIILTFHHLLANFCRAYEIQPASTRRTISFFADIITYASAVLVVDIWPSCAISDYSIPDQLAEVYESVGCELTMFVHIDTSTASIPVAIRISDGKVRETDSGIDVVGSPAATAPISRPFNFTVANHPALPCTFTTTLSPWLTTTIRV